VLLKILSPRWHGIPGDGNSLGFIWKIICLVLS
jgi:hypothetical protein